MKCTSMMKGLILAGSLAAACLLWIGCRSIDEGAANVGRALGELFGSGSGANLPHIRPGSSGDQHYYISELTKLMFVAIEAQRRAASREELQTAREQARERERTATNAERDAARKDGAVYAVQVGETEDTVDVVLVDPETREPINDHVHVVKKDDLDRVPASETVAVEGSDEEDAQPARREEIKWVRVGEHNASIRVTKTS